MYSGPQSGSVVIIDGIGDSRPHEDALDDTLGRKSGDNWKLLRASEEAIKITELVSTGDFNYVIWVNSKKSLNVRLTDK